MKRRKVIGKKALIPQASKAFNIFVYKRFEEKRKAMTNKEKWLSYTSGLSSPQNYIDWGYRYLIGASLQRRVWIGSPYGDPSEEYQPCFPNSYRSEEHTSELQSPCNL